jgi:hypothetical protein
MIRRSDADTPPREPRRGDEGAWMRTLDDLRAAAREDEARRRWATRRANGRASRPRAPASKVKPAAFYKPVALDLETVPGHLRWHVLYLLNLIHWRWVSKRQWLERRDDPERYVPLKTHYLRRVMTQALLPEVKRLLLDRGVIECDGVFRAGSKCLGYRLTPAYRKTERVVCTDDAYSRKIQEVYAREGKGLQAVHGWLRGNLGRLEMDPGKAGRVLATLRPRRRGVSTAEYRLMLAEQCRRIAHKDHFLEVDDYGRVHTLVTSLKRELRACLGVRDEDGALQPLVGLDLANSQPLIAGVVALRYHGGSSTSRGRLLKASYGEGTNPYHAAAQSLRALRKEQQGAERGKGGTDAYYWDREIPSQTKEGSYGSRDPLGFPEDLGEYLRVCEAGQFYRSLTRKGEDVQRNKRRVLVAFYRPNRSKGRAANLMLPRLRAQYPSVANMLREMKRKDHARAAHVMQNYEATLFIHVICNRIRGECPSLPLFTIHDSLLTTPEHVEYVKGIIREEFARLGVRPSLKEERYDGTV